jgi:toxin YoeB
MLLRFTPQGWEDYTFWLGQDRRMAKRVNLLLADTLRTPFQGLGKPEPLKHLLQGFWSRRIDGEHRLVYSADEAGITAHQCRYHY